LGTKAKKKFSQNFLRDPLVIQKIINFIGLKKDDYVIEIGPGDGSLTLPLLEFLGKIDAIEIDRDLCKKLKEKCLPYGNLNLFNIDILNFNLSKNKINNKALRIVGNLPYNISTPTLFHLLKFKENIQDMNFMLQKEVVDRIVAKPNTKSYGRLSVMLQAYCEVQHLFDISPSAFDPIPKVESSLVYIKPRKTQKIVIENESNFNNLVSACFSYKRKTLKNNLKGILSEERIRLLGIDPNLRAETLDISDFIKLTNELKNN
tara:strand:- start:146 stop:928 length:783 start_codon:yes stop_codon:yes gene_type:complete